MSEENFTKKLEIKSEQGRIYRKKENIIPKGDSAPLGGQVSSLECFKVKPPSLLKQFLYTPLNLRYPYKLLNRIDATIIYTFLDLNLKSQNYNGTFW